MASSMSQQPQPQPQPQPQQQTQTHRLPLPVAPCRAAARPTVSATAPTATGSLHSMMSAAPQSQLKLTALRPPTPQQQQQQQEPQHQLEQFQAATSSTSPNGNDALSISPKLNTSRRKQSRPHKVAAVLASEEPAAVTNIPDPKSHASDIISDPNAGKSPAAASDEPGHAKRKLEESPGRAPSAPQKKRASKGGASAKSTPESKGSKTSGLTSTSPKKAGAATGGRRRNSSTASSSKFEAVEDALVAMFAGVTYPDEPPALEIKPSNAKAGKKPVAVTSPTVKKTPPATSAKKEAKAKKLSETSNGVKKEAQGLPKKSISKCSGEESPSVRMGKAAASHKEQLSSPKAMRAKKRTQQQQQQDALLDKFQGPFVPVDEVRNTPSWSAGKEFALKPSQGIDLNEHLRRIERGPTSTLDASYDAKHTDEQWLCVFCHKGPHHLSMGDLYGPYFIDKASLPSEAHSPHKAGSRRSDQDLAAKFILGGTDPKKPATGKKRRSGKTESSSSATSARENELEIWFHEDCLCWLPVVQLIGTRLLGLEKAVCDAYFALCSICKLSGATIACVVEHCSDICHWPCGLGSTGGWTVQESTLQAWCNKHAKLAPQKQN